MLNGSSGAPLVSPSEVKVNKARWRFRPVFNYAVVDVNGCDVAVKSYPLARNVKMLLDNFKVRTVNCLGALGWRLPSPAHVQPLAHLLPGAAFHNYGAVNEGAVSLIPQ